MAGERNKSRREFLRDLGLVAAAALAQPGVPAFAAASSPDVVVASGDDPKAIVKKAVEALGGMKRFVSRGDVVVVKPNIGWDRTPEWAANTNPDVVAAVVEMALDAGAKQVKVFDRTVKDPKICYKMSGIAEAARKAGAKVVYVSELETTSIAIKGARHLKTSSIYKDALECDCYINVPVAKHHGSAKLTMAMKNHMGVTADDRGKAWHSSLHQAIADFSLGFKPRLNILDAYRIVLRGPRTRRLKDVRLVKKVIVGANQASVDACGATLFNRQPSDIPHIALAGEMGVGEIDLAKLKIVQA